MSLSKSISVPGFEHGPPAYEAEAMHTAPWHTIRAFFQTKLSFEMEATLQR